jgi:hypothetical protein
MLTFCLISRVSEQKADDHGSIESMDDFRYRYSIYTKHYRQHHLLILNKLSFKIKNPFSVLLTIGLNETRLLIQAIYIYFKTAETTRINQSRYSHKMQFWIEIK